MPVPNALINLHNPPDCPCFWRGWLGKLERDFMRQYGRPITKRPSIFSNCAC